MTADATIVFYRIVDCGQFLAVATPTAHIPLRMKGIQKGGIRPRLKDLFDLFHIFPIRRTQRNLLFDQPKTLPRYPDMADQAVYFGLGLGVREMDTG
jgi:hypothetical protein